MTQQAQKLGMKNTQFRNATGLPNPEHYTTVHDLGILAGALIRDFRSSTRSTRSSPSPTTISSSPTATCYSTATPMSTA